MKRIKGLANSVTLARIILSIVLLFCHIFSPIFYGVYIVAGVSDMLDGLIARRTNTVSDLGSKLDSVADFIFAVVCLVKLLPALEISALIFVWVAIIAMIKLVNIIIGYVKTKKFIAQHTVLNKIAGLMLFVLPLTLSVIELKYSAVVVCTVATISAIWESYITMKG